MAAKGRAAPPVGAAEGGVARNVAMEPKPNLFMVVGGHTQITLTLAIAVAIALVIFVAGLLVGMLWCHWMMRRRH